MVELAKLEPLPDFVNLAYAILLIIGGIFGFFRVGKLEKTLFQKSMLIIFQKKNGSRAFSKKKKKTF